ncbi:hypothetical protein [Amycolatopsis sp. CFH S0078]|uniref:hypothetical protein n=1 Tax=Amycolatopsis sp. CFH S0078 TaxID=1644108 RepID=UPI00106DDBD0|nr:hypothetical protein [Amycolatopsis sp. CFH S0078]
MTLQVERLFVTWFTSGADGYSHAVTDEEAGRGFQLGADPEAVCGHVVTPVPLAAPPGRGCPRCELYLRARAAMTDLDLRLNARRRRHRKPSLFRRLLSQKPPVRSAFPLLRTKQGLSGGGPVADPRPPAGPPPTIPKE